MKRYVLLVGGSGARVAEALLCASCAGVFQADVLNVLLADTDRRGLRSASLLKAKYTDYERIQGALSGLPAEGSIHPFHTLLNFHAWPERLPGGAVTLQDCTTACETDALLCQALFDAEAAGLDLREGFHGRRTLGETVFAGLLQEAEENPADPLTEMITEMETAAAAGEEIRVVLAGSVCGGTGAAGLPALARYLHNRLQGRAHIGAVLLAAAGDYEDPAKARETMADFAAEGVCSAVSVLGLPRSSCGSAPAEYPHLTDWLAVYCMDVMLHRKTWPEGVFTVRVEMGPLTWAVFGKQADRYRMAYGRLIKAAAAWSYVLGPRVSKRIARPSWIRDALFGWYPHFFSKQEWRSEACLLDVDHVTRLMQVVLLWLGGLLTTLPPEMCHASELAEAQDEAGSHYGALAELVSQMSILDDEARKTEDYDQNMVHRRRSDEDGEAEQTLHRMDAVKKEIARRSAEQEQLNRKMGGAAVMQLLQEVLAKAEDDSAELQARYEEANRRIDHAESIAAPEDLYRITDARTKLERMVRHQQMLDVRTAYIRADVERMTEGNARFVKPMMSGAGDGNALITRDLAQGLLPSQRRLTAREVEKMWEHIIRPADGRTLKRTLKIIRRAPVAEHAPVMSLLRALMLHSMEEGEA